MRHLAGWLERLAVNAKVATVLGSIPASSDTVESEGRQMKQVCKKKKIPKNPPFMNIQGPTSSFGPCFSTAASLHWGSV
jgi:hypothetical protein